MTCSSWFDPVAVLGEGLPSRTGEYCPPAGQITFTWPLPCPTDSVEASWTAWPPHCAASPLTATATMPIRISTPPITLVISAGAGGNFGFIF